MKKLKMREILSYGAGAVTGNVFTQFISLFLLVFFTDMLGLNAAVAGVIYTSVGWLGALSDSVIGYLSDKTGRYKLWVSGGVLATAVIFVLMFTKFSIPESATVWYAFATYFAWSCAYSAYTIAYNAMGSALTTDADMRTLLNAARFALLAIPSIAISVVTPYLTGNHSDPGFYTKGAVAFAVVGVVFIIPCVLGVKEPQVVNKKEKLKLKNVLGFLVGNKQLLVIALGYFLYAMGFNIYYATMVYFFGYHFVSAGTMSLVLFMNAPLSFFVALVVPPMVKKLAKMTSLNFGAVVFIGSLLLMFFVPTSGVIIFICNILALFSLNLMSPIITIMMADAIDYGVWQTGKNVRAVSFAAISVCGKIADGLSGLVIGGTLAFFGYVANQQQTVHAKMGISISYCVIPAVIFVVLILIMNFGWKLNEKRMKEIAADLDSRNIEINSEV